MKYHIHHGPYGSRGEARPIEYRDEKNQTIASYSFSQAWAVSPATNWVTLYATPNKPYTRRIPYVEGQAEAICLAHLTNLGFDEYDESHDTWDHRSFCD